MSELIQSGPKTSPAAGEHVEDPSVLATLTNRSGTTQLVLTADHVTLLYTEKGAQQLEQSVARSRSRRNAGLSRDGVVQEGVSGGIRGMRMNFPLENVRSAHLVDEALTIEMAGRPFDALETDPRGRFVYKDVAPGDAAAFAAAIQRAQR